MKQHTRAAALQKLEQTPRSVPSSFAWGTSHGRGPAYTVGTIGLFIGFAFLSGATAELMFIGAAIVTIALGLAAAMLHADKLDRGRIHLFTHGEPVIGRILGAVSSDMTVTLHYEFEAGGKRRVGAGDISAACTPQPVHDLQPGAGTAAQVSNLVRYTMEVPDRFETGNDIMILVDPDRPDHHRLFAEYLEGRPAMP